MFTAIIASLGRAGILHGTVLSLLNQSRNPDEILLSVVNADRDVNAETLRLPHVRVLAGKPGLTVQRNTALDNLRPDCDLLTFFDDDVELHRDYIRNCCDFMSEHPEVVGMCGRVLADGILTGEISRNRATRLLKDTSEPAEARPGYRRKTSLPGNFMTYRRSVIDSMRFDERLKLYALYEDYDFSARCARLGPLAQIDQCKLVHLGTRLSRISDTRFGYAQVVNPLYFWRKGSQGWIGAMLACLRPLISNSAGLIIPSRGMNTWRRSRRLLGNALGVRDFLFHGPQPERIELI